MRILTEAVADGRSVLLVGEGDFSFAASLDASPHTLVATSLDSCDALTRKYGDCVGEHLGRLDTQHVVHGVDATKLGTLRSMGMFDVICWNFPHTSGGHSHKQVEANRLVLRQFFQSSRAVLNKGGRVCVTLRDTPFYRGFRLVSQATAEGFRLVECEPFEASAFQDYRPVRTTPSKDPNQSAPDVTGALVHVFAVNGKRRRQQSIKSTIASVKPELEACEVCGTGVFSSARRRNAHFNSKRHSERRKRARRAAHEYRQQQLC